MGMRFSGNGQVWSIVLAGGDGTRLTPFITRWLGKAKPKQYCAFVGTRSMFQLTLDRAEQLASPDHTVTVIARSHGEDALSQLGSRSSGTVLIQPANRDTAPGIFLPLTYIRSRAPRATVVVYPSDHFIYPEGPFVETVNQAVQTAEQFPDRLVLLGISPSHLELQYGWIQPSHELGHIGGYRIRAVRAFLEKPGIAEALAARTAGALWNTFVMVGKVNTLWELGWRCLPDMMLLFEQLERAIGSSKEGTVLESIYQRMPARNFSSHLLQRIPDRTAVIEVTRVLWSNWGQPDRVIATLRQIGKSPMFPAELLDA